MSVKKFIATLLSTPDYPNAAFVEIPFDTEKEYGKKGQVKVKATIDGIPYRGSLATMGYPYHILIILKAIREKLGKTHGDTVAITLEQDLEPRVVEVPEALQILFKSNPKAEAFYTTLSYTNQKEYARWITSAKREATVASRLEKTIEKLLAGKKNPSDS